MIKFILILIFLINVSEITAQEKGALGFGVHANYNVYKMTELNQSLDGNFSSLPSYLIVTNRVSISKGVEYGLEINIQTSKLFNFGGYTNYLNGNSENEFIDISGVDEWWSPADTSFGKYNQNVNSLIIGVNSSFFISRLAFLTRTSWLSGTEVLMILGIGYSFSQFSNYTLLEGETNISSRAINNVSGIHFTGKVRMGYNLCNKKLFSVIGFQIGYQHLVTSKLKGGYNYTFEEAKSPRLNFSGLTTGVFLTFGK